MKSVSNITCIPVKDTSKRFLLGKSGNTELLAIGLNPSTANEENLDPTSRNIQTIANNNGCDGWWLVNLYPKRTPKPNNLPKTLEKELASHNIDFIRNMLKDSSYNIDKVVCCWGNHVDDHSYLRNQAIEITNLITEAGHQCLCIGMTNSGNPYHPAPMAVNRFLGGIKNIKLKDFKLDGHTEI